MVMRVVGKVLHRVHLNLHSTIIQGAILHTMISVANTLVVGSRHQNCTTPTSAIFTLHPSPANMT